MVPDYTFVGLRNYERLFQTEKFQADIVNTIHFTAFFLAGCLILGLGAAVLLDQKLRGTIIFQNIFMFPLAISFIVTGTVWRWIFNPNYGLNVLFHNLHLDFLQSGWLTSRASPATRCRARSRTTSSRSTSRGAPSSSDPMPAAG